MRNLLVTAAYGIGSVAGTFDRDRFAPRWEGVDSLASQYSTPIVIDGHAYCIDGRDDVPPADVVCIEAATGRVVWREAGFGYGTLLAADGKLVATKTDGELVLMKASPDGMTILAGPPPGRHAPGPARPHRGQAFHPRRCHGRLPGPRGGPCPARLGAIDTVRLPRFLTGVSRRLDPKPQNPNVNVN